jgi:hypothetical protein
LGSRTFDALKKRSVAFDLLRKEAAQAWHVRELREWSLCGPAVLVFTLFRFETASSTQQLPAMEAHNLQAASTYVNNILLARGLLKSGHPIDFADPENEEGGTDATMARIINLVNDLVLRRDVRHSGFLLWRI